MKLFVELLRADHSVQARVEINEFVVDDYAEAMRLGNEFPPVVVYTDGASYWLADGFHRVRAAHRAGQAEIEAIVHQGSKRDALLFAVGANATHGLPRTNADKRRSVLALLHDAGWGCWSDREIARRCAVSDRFVNTLRAELSANGTQMLDNRKAVRNGKTYSLSTSRIGVREIALDVRNIVRETPLAENKVELRRLARLDVDEQRVVAGQLADGTATSVRMAQRLLQAEAIAQEPPPLPDGPFRVIVADPPWSYDKRTADPSHRGVTPYPGMTLGEIKAFPVGKLADEDSILWLWTTNAFLPEAFEVARSWGFTHKTILTWVKDRMGCGDWLRGQTEHCIMAVRGKPTVLLTNQTTVIHGDVREHSRKPEDFYALVESLCPGSKVELFARSKRQGWTVHGDQVGLFGAAAGKGTQVETP